MAKILYADDDLSYLKLVKMFLSREGMEVFTESDSLKVFDVLCTEDDIDLVILDVMMPEKDGYELCRDIKKEFNVPILMLTALGDTQNEVFGIDNGADEYISKPFKHEVFVARVKALLRAHKGNVTRPLLDEGIEIDEVLNKAIIDNIEVNITLKEIKLLKYLLANKGMVLSRDKLLNHVWGWDYYGDPRTLDTHIKSLRSKIGSKGKKIVTIRGVGYSYRSDTR